MFSPVDEKKQLANIEKEILTYWDEIDAFKTSNKLAEGRPEYIFYDGPPFATGTPHYGHILAGTIKDVVTRYAYQTGHSVPRRFGWDTHGVPVEHEVDKMLNIKDKTVIEKEMGIGVYNEKCRSIVMKHQQDWERVVRRCGRWIDFVNSYKSMDVTFMESVWWVFKQLWEQDNVYCGVKVMPYSYGCGTPLSNFEAGLDYRSVSDPAIYIAFKVPGKDFEVIAWTTTPWTLPSNLILVVNPKMKYAKFVDNATGKKYITMKCRIPSLYPPKAKDAFKILEEMDGQDLVGIEYEPLFPYFANWKEHGAFKIYTADYVTDDSGSGIVHTAPGFGEDDYGACLKHGIITRDGEIVCPIDDNCCFTEEVPDYKGVFVKDADAQIMDRLKKEGRLIKKETIKHEYPYCWRSGTPLIYRCIPSWFVRIEKHRELLIENTNNTHWVPNSIRDGRFIEWLKNARDWAISRNRYWGTPIPIWTDDAKSEFYCIGSIKELEELSGVTGIKDIHCHFIDQITFKSPKTGNVLHRIPEVFDCWFESGSMPFSQFHIPFSGMEWRQADFIAEGLDQTRGWFYTMTILSSLLGHPSPFKNVIVNGLIMAADGKKMSKKEKNYTDPELIMDRFGADAVRLYLTNSPACHADPFSFKDDDVAMIVRQTMLPWMNSIKFWVEQVIRHGNNFKRNTELAYSSENILDKWILSKINRLIQHVHREMGLYQLYNVLPELVKFIDQLNNWYVRLNRDRLKKGKDAETGIAVLFEVLLQLSLLMAPFAPFFAEYAYQHLKPALPESEQLQSIHFVMLPSADEKHIDSVIERRVELMQSAILIARLVRDKKKIPVRRPMKAITIVCSPEVKEMVHDLTNYITKECNILEIDYETDEKKYVQFSAVPDGRLLGKRLGKQLKEVREALTKIPFEKMAEIYDKAIHAKQNGQPAPEFEVAGVTVNTDEVDVTRSLVGLDENKFFGGVDGEVVAFVDISVSKEIEEMNVAREIRARVQAARKALGCVPTDKVKIYIEVQGENDVTAVLARREEQHIKTNLEFPINLGKSAAGEEMFGGKTYEDKIGDVVVTVTLVKA
ncbi:isoleucyl-tRNA synthetase family protein [Trichomonas vaginalis G3]|uniref:isoleucine--tRNA ligase n=1 Tax=Trichomonas vaginalis (strain ATCC PRA-98 / G3) TaxID=412133 RepID=A2FF46_TRIV3|nr:isoleucine--tRNA ligase, cytoplasmic family [Trichomonas vaginalis G3]EAX96459.1 isoleucyl-tRNA synthetase family protein [Trichomonas vaginalis G3]KAI5503322.1 isoleucine--tRNA ligase, cytoplasmic family [Trichomonas vaginalis G3]|eukprot:XP_001309389.1 isoleucyl-tRNA synthetase family protein [Trichomonas vaginalis G3]